MGEFIQNDVVQTTVSFTNHRLITPAPTEAESTDRLVHDLHLAEAKLRDGRTFALLLVKCRRDQLLPQRNLLDEATRLLQ